MYGLQGSSCAVKSIQQRQGISDWFQIPIIFVILGLLFQYLSIPYFQKQTLDFSRWKWLTKVDFGLESIDSDIVHEMESKQHFEQKHFLPIVFPNKRVLGKVTTVDRVVVKAAAPIPVPATPADLTEKRKFMLIHRFLSARLLIAVNTPVISVASIHMASHAPRPLNTQVSAIHTASEQSQRVSIHRKIASVGRVVEEPSHISQGESENDLEDRKVAQNTRIQKAQEWNEKIPDEFRKLAENENARKVIVQKAQLAKIPSVLDEVYYSGLKGIFNQMQKPAALPGTPPLNVNTTVALATANEGSLSPMAPVNNARAIEMARESSTVSFVEAFDSRQTEVEGVQIESISKEPIGENGAYRGWDLALADSHRTTLYWRDLENEPVPVMHINTVKSLESSRLAGVVQQSGAGIIYGRIAPGWQVEVAPNDLLGRSEPVFLDAHAESINGDRFDAERYFVFLNVNPGSRIVYLRSKTDEASGGLAIPVLPGADTYLDLRHLSSKQTLSGTLYDESSHEAEGVWPLGGSTVRVIGQSAAVAITDTNGYFRFSNLITIANYPIYLESYKVVESQDGVMRHLGYTHRYRVSPQDMENLNLYRIARSQIRGWVNQVPNGISRESGLVVAAFTEMEQVNPSLKWVPSVQSLPSSANLTPATYTLSSEGTLKYSEYLQVGEGNRILGAQLPEGPVVVRISDPLERKVVWSELFFATPGVVNMVGPYPFAKVVGKRAER